MENRVKVEGRTKKKGWCGRGGDGDDKGKKVKKEVVEGERSEGGTWNG